MKPWNAIRLYIAISIVLIIVISIIIVAISFSYAIELSSYSRERISKSEFTAIASRFIYDILFYSFASNIVTIIIACILGINIFRSLIDFGFKKYYNTFTLLVSAFTAIAVTAAICVMLFDGLKATTIYIVSKAAEKAYGVKEYVDIFRALDALTSSLSYLSRALYETTSGLGILPTILSSLISIFIMLSIALSSNIHRIRIQILVVLSCIVIAIECIGILITISSIYVVEAVPVLMQINNLLGVVSFIALILILIFTGKFKDVEKKMIEAMKQVKETLIPYPPSRE